MSIESLSSRNPQAPLTPSSPSGHSIALSLPAPSRRGYLCVVGFAALVIATLMASRVVGQNANFPFDSIPMHPALQDEARADQVHAMTRQYANSGQGNTASVNGYFAYYVPAKMTAPDGVKYISEIMDEATTLLGRAERSNRPQVVQALTNYLFDGMQKVADGNHHPAARINALLMLARLNSRPANLANKTPPVPLAKVLPILLQAYQDENNVDGVRAAALQGIHRHVLYGFPQISQPDQATIQQLATDLLDSPPPAERSAKAHAYLQRFAVDILDVLKPQDTKQFATKLVSISTQPDTPDLIALYSAARLGSMSSDLQGQVDKPEDLLKSWTKRILDAYQSDLARINRLDPPTMSGISQPPKPESFLETRVTQQTARSNRMGGGMEDMMEGMEGMDGMDGMDMMDMMDQGGSMMDDMEGMMGMGSMMGMGAAPKANPQPPEVRVSRRKINSVFQQVLLGVTGKASVGIPSQPGGLLAAVSAEKKPIVEKWLTDMEEIVTELNKPELDNRTKWVEKLTEQIELIKEMVGEADPKVEAADPADPQNDPQDDVADELGIVSDVGG